MVELTPAWIQDPFRSKNIKFEYDLRKRLEDVYIKDVEPEETSLVALIINCDLRISEQDICTILSIDYDDANQLIIFRRIRGLVRQVANSVYEDSRHEDLRKMSLTDIKLLCYLTASFYKPFFFAPVRTNLKMEQPVNHESSISRGDLNNDGISSGMEVIQYHSRFNQMWIMVLLLKREYQGIIERHQRQSK